MIERWEGAGTVSPPEQAHAASPRTRWPVAAIAQSHAGRVVILLLVFLSLAPYANACRAGFTFDDEFQIRINPAVMGGLSLTEIFAVPLYPGNLYRPLATLTFALNQATTPDNAAAYHLVNVALHVAVTLLVAWLAHLLFARCLVSFFAGAGFAVHPIHTEAVTSLVGRAEELAACGALISLVAVVYADRAALPWKRRAWFAVSVLGFCAALLSKESALTVLPLVFLLRIAVRGDPWWHGLSTELRNLDWVPYVLCVGLYLLLRVTVIGDLGTEGIGPLNNMLVIVPAKLRIVSALAVLFDNFSQLIAPLVLSADYSHAQVPVLTSWLAGRCLGGVALVVGTLLVAWRGRPRLAFAALLPLIALSLTANLLFPIGTIRGERLLYLPSVGWAILFGVAVERMCRSSQRRVALAAVALWLSLLAGRTWARNVDWSNDFTLHQSTVRAAPSSAKAHYNYAIALQRDGQSPAAMHHFLRCLEIYPWSQISAHSVGRLFDEASAPLHAEQWFEHAVRLDPTFIKAHSDLCRVRLAQKHYADAAAACRDGLRHDPRHVELLKGLGASLIGLGERDKGLSVLRRAAAINPKDSSLHANIRELERGAGLEGVR